MSVTNKHYVNRQDGYTDRYTIEYRWEPDKGFYTLWCTEHPADRSGADQFITETAFRECHLPLVKSGSVLVGITGQGKTRGQAVVLSFEATINQHLAFITPKKGVVDLAFVRLG